MLQFPVIINSIVHIVMYFYYFLASLGPKVQSKLQSFKQFITIFQMVCNFSKRDEKDSLANNFFTPRFNSV